MNEVANLSNDLNVITAEINSYKQVAGQAIFEIGKRLKHVKEKDLAHGEFGAWLEKSVEMSHQHANRFMKVAEELNGTNYASGFNLGVKALYEIATLPEGEREKQHKIPSTGETKTVDEMTVKELREVKKALKEETEAREKAEQEKLRLGQLLTEERNKQPETVEREVVKEIVPERVKKQMEEKDKVLKSARDEIESMQREVESLRRQTRTMDETTKKERELKVMMLDASKSVLKTKIQIDEFLQEVAVTSYRRGAIAASSEGTKQKLQEGVDELKAFCEEMEMALHGTIEHSK